MFVTNLNLKRFEIVMMFHDCDPWRIKKTLLKVAAIYPLESVLYTMTKQEMFQNKGTLLQPVKHTM